MLKLKFIIFLIIAIQINVFSQWEEKSISTNSTLTSVKFVNEEIGFVAGGNDIFKTENGGDNWEIVHTDLDLVIYEDLLIIEDEKIIAVGYNFDSNQSVITKSSDNGTTWANVNVSNSSSLNSVFFTSSNVGYCAGNGGTILKTVDSGDNWQEQNTGTGTTLNSIYFVSDLVGIAVGGSPVSSIILKTQDGGNNWNQVNNPSSNNLQSVYFSNEETGYVVGWNGEIIKTENCGDSWVTQNSVAMNGNLEVLFTDDNTGYIVGGGSNESLIQKTTNAGELWEDVSPEIQEGLVGIHFPTFNTGYAVGSNGTVVKTESGGIMTSTNDLNLSSKFKVFPNPSNGIINIQTEDNQIIERLKLFNPNGQIIKELKPNSLSLEIDLSNLESNIYYLQIDSDKGKSIKKLVKK